MPVLIDEFEVVVKQDAAPPASAEEAAAGGGKPAPASPRPRDVVGILRHHHERALRVRAH